MEITCVSDLHGHYPKLEGGDLLIVAGDLTADDSVEGHLAFLGWISAVKYKKVIYIAGNHDNALGSIDKTKEIYSHKDFPPSRWADEIVYLYDSGTEFEYYDPRFPVEDEGFLPSGKRTLKIWGSPWTLRFEGMNPNCMAFTCETEKELAEKFAKIPDDTEILVTHCPMKGLLDNNSFGELLGSESLAIRALELPHLHLHICGHIHEAYGKIDFRFKDRRSGPFICVNASHVNENYQPVNKPIRIEL